MVNFMLHRFQRHCEVINMSRKLTRREFIKGAAVAGIGIYGAALLPVDLMAAGKTSNPKSRVAIVSADNVLVAADTNPNPLSKTSMTSIGESGHAIDQRILNSMIGDAMTELTKTKSVAAAWKSLFKPSDIVGIKVNCIARRGMSTHPEVIAAIIAGLKLAGVKEENIIVWDRRNDEMIAAGYKINQDGPGVKCHGTNGDHDPTSFTQGSVSGKLSRILSEKITALINVPIMKDHGGAGITSALKNHYGSFDNPGPYHGNNCDPFVAELNCLPAIKNKTRLVICDALKGLANGGPGHNPQFVWDAKTILAATDPVALDYQVWQIIEARRKETGLSTLAAAGREPKHIASAASMGLGTNDPAKMEVVRKTVAG